MRARCMSDTVIGMLIAVLVGCVKVLITGLEKI